MNAGQSDPREIGSQVMAYLRQLRNDRGAMADLRCALSPARLPRAWPLLAPLGGIGSRRIETLAGLYGYHPEEADTGNLGSTCLLLAGQNKSFDARFQRLLGCDRDEICERLRPVILAAKAKSIPVNYYQLFIDLCYWGDSVKARWAREYWASAETAEQTDTGEAAS